MQRCHLAAGAYHFHVPPPEERPHGKKALTACPVGATVPAYSDSAGHAPSKLGEKGREIVEAHVAEMEARNIIRKSNSAWGSRVVLVGKKDGSVRFCVDYRDTNSKLQYQLGMLEKSIAKETGGGRSVLMEPAVARVRHVWV